MRMTAAAALAALMGAGEVGAATVTIDFNEFADPDYEGQTGSVGNVNYEDYNRYLYGINAQGFLVLGDDGFSNSTVFTADPGTYFTPVSLEVGAINNLVRAPCPGCSPGEIQALADACIDYSAGDPGCEGFAPFDDFDYLMVNGYVDGVLVAEQALGSGLPGYSGALSFGSEFAGLSSLTVEVLSTPRGGPPDTDSYAYACGYIFFQGCVSGAVDDFTVALDQPKGGVAPVPVAASLPLLGGALAALGLAARRRRLRPQAPSLAC